MLLSPTISIGENVISEPNEKQILHGTIYQVYRLPRLRRDEMQNDGRAYGTYAIETSDVVSHSSSQQNGDTRNSTEYQESSNNIDNENRVAFCIDVETEERHRIETPVQRSQREEQKQ